MDLINLNEYLLGGYLSRWKPSSLAYFVVFLAQLLLHPVDYAQHGQSDFYRSTHERIIWLFFILLNVARIPNLIHHCNPFQVMPIKECLTSILRVWQDCIALGREGDATSCKYVALMPTLQIIKKKLLFPMR